MCVEQSLWVMYMYEVCNNWGCSFLSFEEFDGHLRLMGFQDNRASGLLDFLWIWGRLKCLQLLDFTNAMTTLS
jgi:hypothetical protein